MLRIAIIAIVLTTTGCKNRPTGDRANRYTLQVSEDRVTVTRAGNNEVVAQRKIGKPASTRIILRDVVKRDPRYIYFFREGDLWRLPTSESGLTEKPHVVKKLGLPLRPNDIYFLDEQGNVGQAVAP